MYDVINVTIGSDEWHAWRRQGVTATDAAVITGMSPYKTPWQLWAEKTGLVEPADLSKVPHVRAGQDNEGLASSDLEQWLEDQEGYTAPQLMPTAVQSHWLETVPRATLDGLLEDGRPAELKRVDGNVRRTFPGLRLLGRYVGTYPKTHHDAILTALRKAAPNFTLIGPGPTARERWVARNRAFLPPGIYLWSAEVFDILAEKRNRVPREVFERGTDFLHDGLRRPWRVLRLPVYGWYLLLLLYHRARHL